MARHWHGIPTTYRKVKFRSRLEARWAAYFDLRNDMTWAYEPIDLRGWIPDFMLGIPTLAKPCLAEVKPIVDILTFLRSPDSVKIATAIIKAKKRKDVVSWQGFHVLGLRPETWWACNHEGRFECLFAEGVREDLDEMWAEAGNVVQWKAPR